MEGSVKAAGNAHNAHNAHTFLGDIPNFQKQLKTGEGVL